MILNSSFPGILPSLELHMRELVRDFAWQMAIEGEEGEGREGSKKWGTVEQTKKPAQLLKQARGKKFPQATPL